MAFSTKRWRNLWTPLSTVLLSCALFSCFEQVPVESPAKAPESTENEANLLNQTSVAQRVETQSAENTLAAAALASQLSADGRRLAIYRVATKETLAVQNARTAKRPYLHPLLAPDGKGVLTEDAPPHHPWQHGLYVGLNRVNEVGFWSEGGSDGTFHPEPISQVSASAARADWRVQTVWKAPNGTSMLDETQAWTLRDEESQVILDLTWTLKARIPITFGKSTYGGLFIRMPYRGGADAKAITSEGKVNLAGEGQRAKWVALQMPIPGRPQNGIAGMALLDHPKNPDHPLPWRIDNELGVGPSRSILGDWKLNTDQSITFYFQVVLFTGVIPTQAIQSAWTRFSTEIPLPVSVRPR